MRTRLFPTFLALLLAIGFGFSQPAMAQMGPLPQTDVVDEIAAVVDDEIILRSEVDQYVMQIIQQENQPYSESLWMEALDDLIDQQVMAAEARRDTTIEPSEQQISDALDRQIGQLVEQAGGEAELEEIYGRSILEIREDFRDTFRTQMLAQQLQERRMRNVRITPSEVREWFEQIDEEELPDLPTIVRLSHIVRYPEPDPAADEEARDIVETLHDSITVAGADFEEMARQFSDDQGSAQRGGRIQGADLDDLYPEFSAVATRLEPGDISQPFETPLGYHIMRLNQRTGNTIDFNHILIQVDAGTADDQVAIDHLSAVRDSIVNMDAPFALMARRHSEEDQSANNAGRVVDPRSGQRDLVYDALGPSWQQTIDELDEGEISEPREVQLLDGDRAFHIVRMERFQPAHRMNIEDDYDRIEQYALQEKRQRKMREWISDLREDTYVDIRVSRDDIAAASQ